MQNEMIPRSGNHLVDAQDDFEALEEKSKLCSDCGHKQCRCDDWDNE